MNTFKRSQKVAKIGSYIALACFCVFGFLSVNGLYSTWKTNQTHDELKEIKSVVTDSENTESAWANDLLAINEDYVGWLTVYGTNADGPVVQGEDNNEYLRTDFYKQPHTAGTFFVDEAVDVTDPASNLIIYGHMMNDGTMFGSFKQYKDLDFFKENNIIRWEDRFRESYYRLFAALLVSGSSTNTNYLNIQQWAKALDAKETEDMLVQLKEKAYIYQENPFRKEGQYIFLVTCEYSQYEGKLVLVGERL